jgi:excisionase family DNA binding protein
MTFSIDRAEAARRLSVSSRTIDRHVSAGRIATKRIGKKMFLEEDHVEELRSRPEAREEPIVILSEDDSQTDGPEIVKRDRRVSRESLPDFSSLYSDAQQVIAHKDAIIQELSYKLGKAETELSSSIPLIEYKKTTFLLEGAKSKTDADAEILGTRIEYLEREMSKRNSAILGLATLFILVLAFSAVFFLYTKMNG